MSPYMYQPTWRGIPYNSNLQRHRHDDLKVKFSLYRPWRPLGVREVEDPTFTDIRLIYGGKVVILTRRPILPRTKIPGTHFC
jgi:hypothetical protein